MDDIRFGAVVRQVRIRLRLRQSDLGRRSGFSRATISRIERGHVATLSLDTIRRIAAAADGRAMTGWLAKPQKPIRSLSFWAI
jgi:transcriptional regulator with XRE-family HTH domain